jgi:hypothetical protein
MNEQVGWGEEQTPTFSSTRVPCVGARKLTPTYAAKIEQRQ